MTPLATADGTPAAAKAPPLQVAALDPVVVTPTLTSRTVDASLSSVTVIDDEQLRRRQPLQFTDVLRGQPGVDVSGNGSFGKYTSVFMRGTSNSSTLLLLNGVRLRSATAGGPAWQFLPARLARRVEIVRGPRGSLYGADAVGGVVQIFTDASATPGAWVETGAGNMSSRHLSAGAAGEHQGTRYSLAMDHFDTDGDTLREHSEERGYDNTAGVVHLSHRFDNDAELGVFGFRSQGTAEYEGSTPAQDKAVDYRLQVAGVKGSLWLTDRWRSTLLISDARDESEDFTDGDRVSVFDTRSRAANWQNLLLIGDHQLVVGGEFLRDTIESTTEYQEDQRDNAAGFAQLLLDFGAVDVQASARHDDNDAFGGETTGGLALGYKVTTHHRLRASYGTAFRAPTFNDLYFPGFSNDELDPESAESVEMGIRGQFRTWFWDLALYQTEVEDLIGYASVGGQFAPYNVDEARIRGAELSGGLELDQWRLSASATVQDSRDRETDNLLQRRSKRSLRVDLDRDLGDVSLGGSVMLASERYDDAANERSLGGHGTLDLRAGWRFAAHWSSQLTVRNLFDKRYATASDFTGWDYLNAGRQVMLTLRYDLAP